MVNTTTSLSTWAVNGVDNLYQSGKTVKACAANFASAGALALDTGLVRPVRIIVQAPTAIILKAIELALATFGKNVNLNEYSLFENCTGADVMSHAGKIVAGTGVTALALATVLPRATVAASRAFGLTETPAKPAPVSLTRTQKVVKGAKQKAHAAKVSIKSAFQSAKEGIYKRPRTVAAAAGTAAVIGAAAYAEYQTGFASTQYNQFDANKTLESVKGLFSNLNFHN